MNRLVDVASGTSTANDDDIAGAFTFDIYALLAQSRKSRF